MINSFRHVGLRFFFETGYKAGIRSERIFLLYRILSILDVATAIRQINPKLLASQAHGKPAGLLIDGDGRAGITAKMDLKLSGALGKSSDLWIRM